MHARQDGIVSVGCGKGWLELGLVLFFRHITCASIGFVKIVGLVPNQLFRLEPKRSFVMGQRLLGNVMPSKLLCSPLS
jgi:hypothetical protein